MLPVYSIIYSVTMYSSCSDSWLCSLEVGDIPFFLVIEDFCFTEGAFFLFASEARPSSNENKHEINAVQYMDGSAI